MSLTRRGSFMQVLLICSLLAWVAEGGTTSTSTSDA